MIERKQKWKGGEEEGEREVVTNDSFARSIRDGKDDEVDYVFQKDARRGDTRRRHTRWKEPRGEYNSATWKPVFHRHSLYLAKLLANYEQEG